ncbi:MAG: deoxyribodipyrimidine photo-lyase [Nitratireductor sp.]|nr:deoxyribodipyrimidine photo-lyase [Nitratireductor sp.]MCC0019800.1 deoxyribodipyrimidine photo-lyase [Nitratireductor sp.]
MGDENDGNQQKRPAIVWFRDDLRVSDNPALCEACKTGSSVICVFVLPEGLDQLADYGSAQKWFLHHALAGLANKISGLGGRLDLFHGNEKDVIRSIVKETNAGSIFWNRRYTRHGRDTDAELKKEFKEAGIEAKSLGGSLLHEPYSLQTQDGGPYRVYSPFWRKLVSEGEPRLPLPEPDGIDAADVQDGTVTLDDLKLLPRDPDWASAWKDFWQANEDGARARLEEFLEAGDGIDGYSKGRDFPSRDNVSRLSPHLRFGTISPYQIWSATRHAEDKGDIPSGDSEKFLKELAWREFSYHLLFHYPDISWQNYNERFDEFGWKEDKSEAYHAWCKGKTGYPIVDAGMRELWQTGYMHNRVRMIVASFLTKHLLIHWRLGEKWFWDTLVDGDHANNAASWQWVAGCGADAAPYFRIFNPITQSRKFDPDGEYIRRYVPEIADLPDKHLHAPWEAPEDVLSDAGIQLGQTYPKPMVEHSCARERALAAYDKVKKDDG